MGAVPRPQARDAPRLPRTQARSWAAQHHERAPTPDGVTEAAPRARCAACKAPSHKAPQTQCTASCSRELTGHEQANEPKERQRAQAPCSRRTPVVRTCKGKAQQATRTLVPRLALSKRGARHGAKREDGFGRAGVGLRGGGGRARPFAYSRRLPCPRPVGRFSLGQRRRCSCCFFYQQIMASGLASARAPGAG